MCVGRVADDGPWKEWGNEVKRNGRGAARDPTTVTTSRNQKRTKENHKQPRRAVPKLLPGSLLCLGWGGVEGKALGGGCGSDRLGATERLSGTTLQQRSRLALRRRKCTYERGKRGSFLVATSRAGSPSPNMPLPFLCRGVLLGALSNQRARPCSSPPHVNEERVWACSGSSTLPCLLPRHPRPLPFLPPSFIVHASFVCAPLPLSHPPALSPPTGFSSIAAAPD